MLKLVDLTATTPVEVEGTIFHIKPLTNGDKVEIAATAQTLRESEAGWDDLLALVSKHIARIDGVEGDIADIVRRIEDIKSQQILIDAVIGASSLKEVDRKNSDSSSGSSSPAGETETV